jgi:hypothetical protein
MSTERLFARAPGPVAPADALHVAHDFVQKCRRWAEEKELPKRRQAVEHSDDPALAAKLQAWVSYAEFLDHTLRELESGTLDHWFLTSELPEGGGTPEEL